MSKPPLVSVVLPVHNREQLVIRAVDSVLAQSFCDFELIVVDDASTDGTPATLNRYNANPRVVLYRNEINLGAAGARSRGIELARGRYIAFQDSDDFWFPYKLQHQISALLNKPDCRACYCGAIYFAREQCYYIPRAGTIEHCDGDIFEDILLSNPTTPQTLLVERSVFSEIGAFDASLRINEDWEFALRLAQHTRLAFVEEPLAVIYRTSGSVSSDMAADVLFREKLLNDYALHYACNRSARGRQNYILGALHLRLGEHRAAVRSFLFSLRDVPSLRCAAQVARVPVHWFVTRIWRH